MIGHHPLCNPAKQDIRMRRPIMRIFAKLAFQQQRDHAIEQFTKGGG